MNKHKYYYNPKTLNYERIKGNWKRKMWVVSGWIATTLFFSVIIYSISSTLFRSPRENRLSDEVRTMQREYRKMESELSSALELLADIQRRDDNIYRSMFEAEPVPTAIRLGGIGGSDINNAFKGLDNSKLMLRVDTTLMRLKAKLVVQSNSFKEVENMVKEKEARIAGLPAIQPISNEDLTRFASGFGPRLHPIYKTYKFHYGIDFTAPRGTPIYATADGVIKKAVSTGRGFGNHIVIDHGFGFETLYAHMQKFAVSPGQQVKRGEMIGYVGNTGLSTAPHLHYEIHKNGKPINPINFFHEDLSPEEYELVLDIATRAGKSLD